MYSDLISLVTPVQRNYNKKEDVVKKGSKIDEKNLGVTEKNKEDFMNDDENNIVGCNQEESVANKKENEANEERSYLEKKERCADEKETIENKEENFYEIDEENFGLSVKKNKISPKQNITSKYKSKVNIFDEDNYTGTKQDNLEEEIYNSTMKKSTREIVTSFLFSSLQSAKEVLTKATDTFRKNVEDAVSELRSETTAKPKNKITFPWETCSTPEEVKRMCLDLSMEEKNFTRNPPLGIVDDFNYEEFLPLAEALLDVDENLRRMRYKLVPKVLKEEQFWRNYFYRIQLISRSELLQNCDNLNNFDEDVAVKLSTCELSEENVENWDENLENFDNFNNFHGEIFEGGEDKLITCEQSEENVENWEENLENFLNSNNFDGENIEGGENKLNTCDFCEENVENCEENFENL